MFYQYTQRMPFGKPFPYNTFDEEADLKTKIAVAKAISEITKNLQIIGGEALSDPSFPFFINSVYDSFSSIVIHTYSEFPVHNVLPILKDIASTGVSVELVHRLASPIDKLNDKVFGIGHFAATISTYSYTYLEYGDSVELTLRITLHEKFPFSKAIALAESLGTTIYLERYPKTTIQEVAKAFEIMQTEAPVKLYDPLVLYFTGMSKHQVTHYLYFSPTGNVHLYLYRTTGPFGNILKDKGRPILQAAEHFQNELSMSPTDPCSSCPLYDKCQGGNPEFWVGDGKADKLCPIKAMVKPATPTFFV